MTISIRWALRLWIPFTAWVLLASFHGHDFLVTAQSQPQERNTEWLEEQIDSFLTKAENNGEPTDIQVSSCKISGQQLVATAQATIARALKGVCNPNQFEDKFHNLESQLGDQLNVIKTMIISLEEKVVQMDQDLKRNQQKRGNNPGSFRKRNEYPEPSHGSSPSWPSPTPTNTRIPNEVINPVEEDTLSGQGIHGGPRFDEMSKYNSTLSLENGRRVFSYYWVVSGMSYKLSSWSLRRSLESSSFYIYPGGYRMYLKVIPRYSLDTMYVHTGITKGDYDDMLSWPFKLKLRLSILSMEDETGAQDLKSRIWDPTVLCSGTNWMKPVMGNNPECLGLGFPHDVIKSTEYVHSDRTFIKLSVYLE